MEVVGLKEKSSSETCASAASLKQNENLCALCKTAIHQLYLYPKLHQLTPPECLSIVKKLGLCVSSLKSGHPAKISKKNMQKSTTHYYIQNLEQPRKRKHHMLYRTNESALRIHHQLLQQLLRRTTYKLPHDLFARRLGWRCFSYDIFLGAEHYHQVLAVGQIKSYNELYLISKQKRNLLLFMHEL